jgi:predicted MFS family arabinose efflux permease
MAGNARIQFSASAARTVGPGFAGLLVQWLTAPLAIALDAASFLVAGLVVGSIRRDEPKPEGGGRTWPDIANGMRRVTRHPLLRPLVLCGGTHNICSTMIVAVYVLYVTRELHVGPAMLGLIFSMGGAGALVGSVYASRVARRLGVGPVLVVAQALTGMARLLIPLAGGPLLLACSEFLLGAMRAVFNITQISLRQAVTPPEWQGRVNASIGFLLWAAAPVGALAGGYLAAGIGMRATLWIAASGVTLSTLWALGSRLRVTRTLE